MNEPRPAAEITGKKREREVHFLRWQTYKVFAWERKEGKIPSISWQALDERKKGRSGSTTFARSRRGGGKIFSQALFELGGKGEYSYKTGPGGGRGDITFQFAGVLRKKEKEEKAGPYHNSEAKKSRGRERTAYFAASIRRKRRKEKTIIFRLQDQLPPLGKEGMGVGGGASFVC